MAAFSFGKVLRENLEIVEGDEETLLPLRREAAEQVAQDAHHQIVDYPTDLLTVRGQREPDSPTVTRVVTAIDQAFLDEPIDQAGYGRAGHQEMARQLRRLDFVGADRPQH
jgi:hypothetical protein